VLGAASVDSDIAPMPAATAIAIEAASTGRAWRTAQAATRANTWG